MTGYTYTTTDGKVYQVQFGETTGDCQTLDITPYCLEIMKSINL